MYLIKKLKYELLPVWRRHFELRFSGNMTFVVAVKHLSSLIEFKHFENRRLILLGPGVEQTPF